MGSNDVRAAKINGQSVLWASVVAAVGSLIGIVITKSCSSEASDKPVVYQRSDSGTNNSAGGNINTVSGNGTLIQSNDSSRLNVIINPPDTSKRPIIVTPAPIIIKPAPTTVIDQRVTSYNAAPGSITAHTVIFNSDTSSAKLKDNYDVKIEKHDSFYQVVAKPKVGSWRKPFYGAPDEEYDGMEGEFGVDGLNVKHDGRGGQIRYGQYSAKVNYSYITGNPATPDNPVVIKFKKWPSKIFVGDWDSGITIVIYRPKQ